MKIKNILVPIDFSECSINALKMAMGLAKMMKSKITIMNACQDPKAFGEISKGSYAKDLIKSIEAKARESYAKLEETLDDLDAIDHEFIIEHAYAQDAILDISYTHKYDLVVMGTTGASGLQGILFGSITYAVIKKIECPLLAVPDEAATGKSLRNIVLTGDYKRTASKETFDILIALTKAYNSEIQILHVSDTTLMQKDQAAQAQKFSRYFKNLKHSFHFRLNVHTDESINTYLEENRIDLLVMVAKKHNLLDRIFNGSMTKKMAYHSTTPLLILHEKQS